MEAMVEKDSSTLNNGATIDMQQHLSNLKKGSSQLTTIIVNCILS